MDNRLSVPVRAKKISQILTKTHTSVHGYF